MSTDPISLSRRGLMLVLSSPSGAGKSTLARLLLSEEEDLTLSISVTTRQRRASEVEGQHYYFIEEAAFLRMRDHGELLESAEVHGNFYGTPREPVEKALAGGRDVLFDIDWQGTEQLSQNADHAGDLVRVFVLPPNFRELRSRLERRAEDTSETIAKRLINAQAEIGKWTQYDYVIVNEDLGESFPAVRAILRAERQKRERVVGLQGFVDGLLREAGEAVGEITSASQEPSATVTDAAAATADDVVGQGAGGDGEAAADTADEENAVETAAAEVAAEAIVEGDAHPEIADPAAEAVAAQEVAEEAAETDEDVPGDTEAEPDIAEPANENAEAGSDTAGVEPDKT